MDSTTSYYLNLTRIDTNSSIDSDATAPNLPGPGRIVGNIYDHLGGRLETVLNRQAARFGRRRGRAREAAQDAVQVRLRSHTNTDHPGLDRNDSTSSVRSVDTNATAPNLPGAGRTVGLFLDFIGGKLETAMSVGAVQLRLDPDNVMRAIRQICQHDKRPLVNRHRYPYHLSKSESRNLRKLCMKLIEYTRCVIHYNTFI